MSRNGSGTYTKVNTFTAGTPITAAAHNANWDDAASEITNSVAADGQTSMTGPLKASSGTVAAPSHTFGSDTDTGAYRIGSNNYGIAAGGTKIVDVASTGMAVTGDVSATGVVKQNGFALMPLGIVAPYAGLTAPDGWLLCYGQAVSRTTYAALFNILGGQHGSGDGSTTFNLPDLRGRVVAGQDDMGGSSADRLTGLTDGVDGDTFAAGGGLESNTLSLAKLPTGITSANASQSITVGEFGAAWQVPVTQASTISSGPVPTSGGVNVPFSGNTDWKASELNAVNSISVTSNNTSGEAHNNVQPTLILNYIIYAGV